MAVIAVDPSSRRSGGALLGDRTRIETDPDDAGVFVRSMAARRRLGGLADLTFPARGADARLLRLGDRRDGGRRPIRSRGRRLCRPGRLLRATGLGRRAAVHEGRASWRSQPRARHQGRHWRPGAPRAADVRGALSLAAGTPPPMWPRFGHDRRRLAAAVALIERRSAARSSPPRCRRGAGRRAASGPSRGSPNCSGGSGSPRWPRARRAGQPVRGRRELVGGARAAVHEIFKNI